MEKFSIRLPRVISISTSVILMIVGAFLVKYRGILINQIIFLLAISLAVFGLVLVVRKFRQNLPIRQLFTGLLMMALGIVIAVFSDQIAQYGLIVVGAIFVIYGLVVIIQSANHGQGFYLALGITRIVIGTALIVIAFVTGSAQEWLALVTGILAITLGLLFLVFEK